MPFTILALAWVPVAAGDAVCVRGRTASLLTGHGYIGPAFEVGGMLVWGFTAGLLDRLLELAGWAQPWDPARVRDLPM